MTPKKDEYMRGYADGFKDGAGEMLAALKKASQLADIATDWNLDEVEIDGEMVKTYDLCDEFDAAISKAEAAFATRAPECPHNCNVGGICLAEHSGYPKSCPIRRAEGRS